MMWQQQIITAQAALNTVGLISFAEVGRAIYTKFIIVFGPGTTAGTIVIEEAHTASYGGAWVNQATVAWATADKAHSVLVTGPTMFLRARISVLVANGTVDVYSVVRY